MEDRRSFPEPHTECRRRIYAVDIGSTLRQAFAWAATNPGDSEVIGCTSISTLVDAISADLQRGISIALGFEAPLFLPIPDHALNLSRGRKGEGSRSCMAPIGGYVATLALQQAAWCLRQLRRACGSACFLTLDVASWPPRHGERILFCWEALVSGDAHARRDEKDGHLRDAATAARFFADHEDALTKEITVTAENPLSMIGAAGLWSGWSEDVRLLRKTALVLRPKVTFAGEIRKIWV